MKVYSCTILLSHCSQSRPTCRMGMLWIEQYECLVSLTIGVSWNQKFNQFPMVKFKALKDVDSWNTRNACWSFIYTVRGWNCFRIVTCHRESENIKFTCPFSKYTCPLNFPRIVMFFSLLDVGQVRLWNSLVLL